MDMRHYSAPTSLLSSWSRALSYLVLQMLSTYDETELDVADHSSQFLNLVSVVMTFPKHEMILAVGGFPIASPSSAACDVL